MSRTRKLDLSNQRFGNLTAIKPTYKENGRAAWKCLCICGGTTIASSDELKSGKRTGCGCHQHIKTHNQSQRGKRTPEYQAWISMKSRCYTESTIGYHNYGGRGITVCDRWIDSFENFFEDMGLRPSKKHSLDRIENMGNYEPGNCRWTIMPVQRRNTRRTVNITYQGRTQCLKDWATEYGMTDIVLKRRLTVLEWSIEKSLTTPVKNVKQDAGRSITFNGKTQGAAKWAKETGLPSSTIRFRILRGWSIEKALTTPKMND